MNLEEFKTQISRPHDRTFKVKGSWGVYDVYKRIRKNKWKGIGRPLTEKQFYRIIRGINNLLAENIANGKDVVFPAKMGKLELRKSERGVSIVDDKLKITYPIDWGETLKLWYEDVEARKAKILKRFEIPYLYRIKYDKFRANYENKIFYEFTLNRFIKEALKENIKNGKIDTLW